MRRPIFVHESDLVEGKILGRPNRFILLVDFGFSTERVYLANPGVLSTVVDTGRRVLCEPVGDRNRKTDYNAFAIDLGEHYVTVNSVFANTIFFACFG